VTNIQTLFFQLLSYTRATIAAKGKARLLSDIGPYTHIRALPTAGGAIAESPKSTGADAHHLAQMRGGKGAAILFDELEPHGF